MADSKASGVLIVDKPAGPTSHGVVAKVRRVLKTRHVGHAGTLDPMATGVLVVAVGEATKLVPWLTAAAKEYIATIQLGIETDTLDAEGTVTARVPISEADLSVNITSALASELSRKEQSPPAYSAIKIDGERAHALARSGRLDANAELPARPVEVSSLELLSINRFDDGGLAVTVNVAASKGYFVRSLARDLARALNTVGHLTSLRRTRSGVFQLRDAIAVDDVMPSALISTADAAMRALPVTKLNEDGVRAARLGQRVLVQHRAPESFEGLGPSAWIDAATSRLVAIGKCDEEGVGRVLRGFPPTT